MLPEAIAREVEQRCVEFEAGRECVGSKHHSPRPLRTWSTTMADGTEVWLCGTCYDNLALLLTLLGKGALPWDAHRQFGNEIRKLAGGRSS